jgi:signal transduction histidine kinase
VDNFGFINAWRDSDGIFRRVPLYMNYKENIFPSFALATLLSVDDKIKFEKRDDTILIHFSTKKPKVISAIDILNNKVPLSEIQGKIVVLGSSAVGVNSKYTISTGEEISNNMIHAISIDNLLSHDFLVQPEEYKKINIALSFVLSMLIFFLLFNRYYVELSAVLFIVLVSSFLWTWNAYSQGIYVSIAYLMLPLFYFLLLLLLYHGKVMSNERTQQEKLLIRQSKLASMGEMITLIAHQWRQPLSVVNGIVLNIDVDHRKKILDETRLNEHLNKIEETTAYLSKTINDFTDFFSKNKGKEAFYLADLIEQSLQLTGVANQKDVEIVYRRKVSTKLMGHRSELIQSILIILNNAIYATLKNLSHVKKASIIIDADLVNENLVISIADNGGGIEEKDLKQLFDPYYTTKDKTHGTGLGLYILKLIVEDSMNGRVYASNSKEGAVFTIQIPKS